MQTTQLLHSTALRYGLVLSLVAASASFAAPRPAAADVRYTMTMQMGQGGSSGGGNTTTAPQIRRTVMLKDRREREEMTMNMGPMSMDRVTLTECDKQQVIQLDPALKLYTVKPMDSALTPNVAMTMGPQRNQNAGQSSGTGKMISTISVQDLGTEKVADLDTHHFMMTTHMQTTGCAGSADTTTKVEMWVAPIKAGLDCPEMFAPTRSITTDSGCQMSVEQNGDLSAMHDMYGGMPVRMKIYNGDKVIGEMDMQDYSTAALDSSLFDVPADYKQVSEADFEKAQQQAMMQSMRGGGGMPPQDNSSQTGANDQSSPSNSNSSDQSGQNDNQQNGNAQNDNSSQNNSGQNSNNQPQHHGFSLPNIRL